VLCITADTATPATVPAAADLALAGLGVAGADRAPRVRPSGTAMGLFRKQPRFPADMLRRLDFYGRAWLDTSGVDSSINVYEYCIRPFREDAMSDPDGFLSDLRALTAGDRGGFAANGAAGLAWEYFGEQCGLMPSALPVIDAGIRFKLDRMLSTASLTGYEMARLVVLREQAS
jgi:hypothetical protein